MKDKEDSNGNGESQDKNDDGRGGIWDSLDDASRTELEAFALDYREFLSASKTERAVVANALAMAGRAGLACLEGGGAPAAGGGWLDFHGKLLGLWVPGSQPPSGGFNIIVVHGDAPRLDLKPRCVMEEAGFGLLKSNLYGGLKKYQWLARPLALWGFCALKDGRTVDVRFGEEPDDPVLTITDILPHLDRKIQREKKVQDAFPAERLNVLANSVPAAGVKGRRRVKKALLDILLNRWGIGEDDLVSSELEIVPAGPAREVGLDGSLLGGYGHDDRLNVFCALRSALSVKKPKRPVLVVVFDREEIGSYGTTGAESNFITRLAARAFKASGLEPSWHEVTEALARSRALSADVEAAADPVFKEATEDLNSARMGRGPCVVRYTGGAGKYGASEARAEYMAFIRRTFDGAGVVWQSTLLGRQEEGGGGTVALHLAYHGVSIVDCGAPVLSMHSPFEICSKADLWMNHKAQAAFLASE
ncbi:MAG: aminopeptidase [Deltaproteobacteria bacterium]|jgi:aspartyl aminopeptidase|nr:aminopeptidase [Deltaproteobacteria bacterium]